MRRALLLSALMVMLPATSWAQETCQDDADCAAGQYCVWVPIAECPPCEPGDECSCESDPSEPEGYCTEDYEDHEDYDGSLITNTECASDADCPSGFYCEENMMPCMDAPTCACATCPEGVDCEECECEEPEPCESTSAMYCTYKPTACDSDADCGENFECYEDTICSGGGSSGGCVCPETACACEPCDGPDCEPCDCGDPIPCECDDEPVDFEESCETVGAWCAPAEIACTQTSECPADWECYSYTMSSDCGCAGAACPEGADCEPVECDCPDEPETTTEGFCVPGGWTEVIDSVSAGEYGAPQDGEATSGGGNGAGSGDSGGAAKGGLGGLLGGNAANVPGGSGDADDNGVPNDGTPTDGTGGTGGASGNGSGGGCSTATDAATGMAAIFAILLGIFAVLTRRAAVRED